MDRQKSSTPDIISADTFDSREGRLDATFADPHFSSRREATMQRASEQTGATPTGEYSWRVSYSKCSSSDSLFAIHIF